MDQNYQQNTNPIFKDYILKIKTKSYFNDKDIIAEDVNNLIIFLNWCFHKKNNFFIPDFNKKNIYPICVSYNQLKTNILSKEYFVVIEDIFTKIDKKNLKTLKFVLYHYINNFDLIQSDIENIDLCNIVTKNSIKNCINYLTNYLEKE